MASTLPPYGKKHLPISAPNRYHSVVASCGYVPLSLEPANIMRTTFFKTAAICLCIFAFTAVASAQRSSSSKSDSVISTIANGAGKVTVVVVGSAAKVAWATTKIAAKDVAKPLLVSVAKPLLLKATPAISGYALKLTGQAMKKAVPFAAKLGMAYLKAKLPI